MTYPLVCEMPDIEAPESQPVYQAVCPPPPLLPPPLTNPCSWQIDGQTVRVVNNDGSGPFPTKPVYVYMSVWDAGYISNGQWAGTYTGHDQPYYT